MSSSMFSKPEPTDYLQGNETLSEIKDQILLMAYDSIVVTRVLHAQRILNLRDDQTMAVLAHTALVALREQQKAFVDYINHSPTAFCLPSMEPIESKAPAPATKLRTSLHQV